MFSESQEYHDLKNQAEYALDEAVDSLAKEANMGATFVFASEHHTTKNTGRTISKWTTPMQSFIDYSDEMFNWKIP